MKRGFIFIVLIFVAAGTFIYSGIHESAARISETVELDDSHEDTNLFLLASLIESEASGKSYSDQVAVGAVALNRLRSSMYPDTLPSVIYQEGGFRSVSDGGLDMPRQDSLNAAKDALNGWDPTYGALDIPVEGR